MPVVKPASYEAFKDLYMPHLVYLLLGGEHSKSRYDGKTRPSMSASLIRRDSYSLICETFDAPEHCPVHTGAQEAFMSHEMSDILQHVA